MPRHPLLPLLVLLAACASNPGDPENLELVRVQGSPESPQPRAWRARLEATVEGTGPIELWLPLPLQDDVQDVRALVLEVDPPATFQVEQAQGGRTLHAQGPSPRLRAGWRATLLRVAERPPAGDVAVRLPHAARATVDGQETPVITRSTCEPVE